jgi:flagellar biosynthesis GTPase FlhF
LVTSLSIGIVNVSAQNDWTFSVNVSAKDIETKNQLDGVSILITDKISNARVHSAVSSADQKIKLNLEPGHDYVLKISKNGYVSKTISISTRNVPVFDKTVPSFIFDVSADIFTEQPNEDYSAFRQAFGMILFDETKKDFIWIPNPDAKQKEEDLKEKRKENRKKEEKSQKKNVKEEGKDELEALAAKKEEALRRAKEREDKRKEEQAFRESMRQEALSSFNVDYDAPRMLYAKVINTETDEQRNYIATVTKVIFDDGRKVVFRKIVFEWGGIYYKQDDFDITDVTYNLLMKIIVLKQ